METESLFHEVAAFGLNASVATTVLAVVAFGYVIFRTSSLHPLRARVWRIVMGQSKCQHEAIARAIQDRDDLIQFRHFLGIRARTVHRAAAIAEWARKYDEEPVDIDDCDDLFDRDACTLRTDRVPGRWMLATRFVTWIAALLILTAPWFLFGVMHSGEALVTLKGSGEWVWISETSVRSFWGYETLSPDSCPYGVKLLVPNWPEYGLMTRICDSFVAPDLKHALHALKMQTWVLVVGFTVAFLPFAWSSLRWARAGFVASRMLRRHARHTSSLVAVLNSAQSLLGDVPAHSVDMEQPNEDGLVKVT